MDLFKNKFLLILIAATFVFGVLLALNWTDFVEGFKEGWESACCDCA
ncbi:hypothetical protein [Cecembia lonarensis]|uniref:Uncharacterized protein n=1 Tax=Cecembia lonarensis (strain CCUG 58316 / KCTC 22772 / LW9) TaxID=1225176 RepID=K1LBS6_CECL9|nr:hypothetical protein [Cecembia lonarensis]EKB47753.1 hypothetical protein B879_03632 [Cecembia lonarensis LW9]